MTDTVVRESVDRSPGPEPENRQESRGQWRPLLVRMHFYAGILVAPFIFLACLTGAIYVFNPQIDRLLEPSLVVENSGKPTLPLNEQVAKAMASQPGLNVVSVVPNTRPDEATRVNFNRPGAPEMTYRTAFVNPYTGKVQGSADMSMHGGGTQFSAWMAQFHGDMGLGEFGRWYSEMASLWIVILTLGGIVVWWQRCAVHRKITSGIFWKRFGVVSRGKRPGVKRTMSWHSVIGVWTAVLALLFGLTGLPFARTSGPKWVGLTTDGSMHASATKLDTKLPGAQAFGAGSGTSGGSRPGSTAGSQGGTSGSTGAGSAPNASAGAPSGHDMSGMDMSGMNHDMSGMSGMSGSGTQPGSGKPTGAAAAPTGQGGTGNTSAGTPAGGASAGGAPTAGTANGHGGSGGTASGASGGGHGGMTMNAGVPQAVVAKADLDAMATAAAAAGVNQKIRITPSARPGTGWTFAENKSEWPLATDSALLDPSTSKVVRTFDWEKQTPTLDKLNRYILLFHFGRLFGLVGQVIFGLTMLAVLWIVWWGYKMWWQRRPRGSAWRLGKVPARGSWRKAPKISLAIWGAVTLALFWVLPVLAVSTLGFLLIDAALGKIQALRARTPEPAAG